MINNYELIVSIVSEVRSSPLPESEEAPSGMLLDGGPSRSEADSLLLSHFGLQRGARGEDSVHFEQLLDSLKSVFVEEELSVDYGRMINYVKQTEPLILQGADRSRVDVSTMEHLLRSFHETWKQAITLAAQTCSMY